jgi:glycosyltransferase involved in cell wall biosynthesis
MHGRGRGEDDAGVPGDGGPAGEVRVGYLVSRFPALTETFILRELQGVDAQPGTAVTLMSLYPTPDRTVHADAEAWVPRRFLPTPRRALGAVGRWAVRRPGRTAAIWARVLWDHRQHPAVLGKALATTALGFAHAEHVERERVAHVHAHFAALPGLAAWTIHRLTGVPYSITAHAHDVFSHQAGLRTRLRAARFVTAISRYHQMFLMHFGARPGRTPLLPLGLDLERYAFREREIPREGPVDVLFVSSFRTYKGHRFLIEALALEPRLGRLRVELIGTGPLREEVEALARERGVAGQLVFAGPRPQEAVLARLGEAHVLVQPSTIEEDGHTEGLPTTLVEAAASGVTTVASRVTGVPDLVREGETGFLADAGDARSLADALLRAIEHPDPRALQRAGRAHVEEWHDLRRVSATLASWFAASARGEDREFVRPAVDAEHSRG